MKKSEITSHVYKIRFLISVSAFNMADEIANLFLDSDSDASFEGFGPDDVGNYPAHARPQYLPENIRLNVDLPSDLAAGWSREWSETATPPFTGSPGITANLDIESDYMDFYNLFIKNDDFELMSVETNRYYHQILAQRQLKTYSRLRGWFDTCAGEMKQFIGLTLLMGMVHKPNLASYWSLDELLSTPAFGNIMPRDRFLNILTCFHLNNNEYAIPRGVDGYDPIYKVRPIYDVLSTRFRAVYVPTENICIDESMVPWKGRLFFRQYIPSKPERFGIKLYTLCESESGYVCDFDIYSGAEYDPNPDALGYELHEGHSYNVILGLLRRNQLLNKGYTLYVDNYYTSPSLFDSLAAEDTLAVGTARTNRKQMPVAMQAKLGKGDIIFRQRNQLLALKWHDKRDVVILSTKHSPAMTITNENDRNGNVVEKPSCILDYNKHMGGVDTADQVGKYYSFTRKSLKWWVKLFFYLHNTAVTNAYTLYLKHCSANQLNAVPHVKFQTEVARALLNSHEPQRRPRGRPSDQRLNEVRLSERHFPEPIPAKPGAKKQNPCRKCVVCNKNSGKRFTPGEPSNRKETRFWCPECKKAMCVHPCFRRYHTLVHPAPDDDA